jgi:hypothetical protein
MVTALVAHPDGRVRRRRAGALRRALLAAPLLALSAASGRAAGWDRVEWGMTAREVAAAYGDRVKLLSPPIEFGDSLAPVVLLDTPFGGYGFRVYFQIDKASQRLAHVLLERRRQYADPEIFRTVIETLRRERGREDLVCDRRGGRGAPSLVERIWRGADATVVASYLDFAAPVLDYPPEEILNRDRLLAEQPRYKSLYPQRRLLIRYGPGGAGASCAGAR